MWKAKVKEQQWESYRIESRSRRQTSGQGRPAVHGTSARKREKDNERASEREGGHYHRLTDVSHKDSLSRAMYYSVNVYVRVYVCVYACVCVSRAWVRARVHAIRWLVCGRVAGAENTYDETGDARLWYENRHTNEHLNAFPPRVVC